MHQGCCWDQNPARISKLVSWQASSSNYFSNNKCALSTLLTGQHQLFLNMPNKKCALLQRCNRYMFYMFICFTCFISNRNLKRRQCQDCYDIVLQTSKYKIKLVHCLNFVQFTVVLCVQLTVVLCVQLTVVYSALHCKSAFKNILAKSRTKGQSICIV